MVSKPLRYHRLPQIFIDLPCSWLRRKWAENGMEGKLTQKTDQLVQVFRCLICKENGEEKKMDGKGAENHICQFSRQFWGENGQRMPFF